MGPSLCFCDMVFTIKCAMRLYVRFRSAWRSLRGSCPQMTGGWQGLCQTGRQVALGSRSRTWVLKPCCTGPSCARTQTGRHAHPEPAESQRRCAWGCLASRHRSMLQAGNGMFPWGEGQKMIIKKRSISASDGWMSPKQQGPDGLSVCSWVQRRIHLHVYKTCSHRNFQLLLDCSHLQGTGSECCWFMASHSLRSVFVYVCKGGKKGGMEVSLGQHCT